MRTKWQWQWQRLLLGLALSQALWLPSSLPASAAAAAPMNVVVLLADDLGWTGLRCFGSDYYETPNLDRLAESGVRFTDSYSACTVCSPTRAALMTGLYPARLHLTDFIAGQNRPRARLAIPPWTKGLEAHHSTIAELLRDAGYATAHVGKWHLDFPGRQDGPTAHGFTTTVGRPPGARGYQLAAPSEGESRSSYLTDYLTDEAVAWIDAVRERPFFLYFAYHVPHTPIQGRPDLVQRFRERLKPQLVHNNPEYAAMVASLDDSAGRILERLERHQIANRTLVIFTSDNGGLTQRYGKRDEFTENLPLRRGKGSAFEGGVRVPTIVRWPGVTKPGTRCAQPIITMDILPTALDAAGIAQPTPLDGLSLRSLIEQPEQRVERDLFWHYPHYHAGGDGPYSAVRSGEWRLIENLEDGSHSLYNLAQDIGEQTDLAAQAPQRVRELAERLNRWRTEVGAQMPRPNPRFDPDRQTQVGRRAAKGE